MEKWELVVNNSILDKPTFVFPTIVEAMAFLSDYARYSISSKMEFSLDVVHKELSADMLPAKGTSIMEDDGR